MEKSETTEEEIEMKFLKDFEKSKETSFENFSEETSTTNIAEKTAEKYPQNFVLTLRVFLVSTILTFVVSYINQIGSYRRVPFSLDPTVIFLLSYPILRCFAAFFPSYHLNIFGCILDTNPGPVHLREHLLISVVTCDASSSAYVSNSLYFLETKLHRQIGWLGNFLVIFCTKFIGYGIACFSMRVLIEPEGMMWPGAIYTLEIFRMLHEKGAVMLGGRLKIFCGVFMGFFVYSWFPGFLLPGLSSLSLVCWLFSDPAEFATPASTPPFSTANVLGRGFSQGFGLASLDLNFSNVWNFYGFLSFIPWQAGLNVVFGGVLLNWILGPIVYFSNLANANRIPPTSLQIFTQNGSIYPLQQLFDDQLAWQPDQYTLSGSPYLSALFATSYWFSFLGLPAAVSTLFCRHFSEIRLYFRRSFATLCGDFSELPAAENAPQKTRAISAEARLMNEKYGNLTGIISPLSGGLFLAFMVVFSCCTMSLYEIPMPWWAVAAAVAVACIFVVPIGTIQALTSVQIGLNILAEILGGFLLPHNPIGAILVKVFAYMSLTHALNLIANLKLAQYVCVNYRIVLLLQLWGTLVTCVADTMAYRSVMDRGLLFSRAGWDSQSLSVYISASYLWGGIGPWQVFLGPSAPYFYSFWSATFAGLLLPVLFWGLGQRWHFFRHIHLPLISIAG
eukprot:Sdes_comp20771_c0_seq1m16799